MKVIVGSLNPVKINATLHAFKHYYNFVEVVGVESNSRVPDQPIGKETFEGAYNRVRDIAKRYMAEFYVGIEGGIYKIADVWFSFGAVCIMDKNGKIGWGTSPMFTLPDFVVKKLQTRVELGEVMDELIDEHNSKQKQGAIGYLSKGVIDRMKLYEMGVIMALVPFINSGWYFK